MLVLGRKRGEGIVIGDDITVTVVEIRGDRVKLGFSAPAEVPIHRTEVHQKIEDASSAEDPTDDTPVVAFAEVHCPQLQEVSV